ncbi:hypothetical protein CKO15_08080 [Halorhodospira abdelmalekii]|uniref:class I SAM-dependent methyltransferase n=1 Tax=Halorhodospira abdelmalekii TaxID=421629 RepID=UPI001905CAE7|nr:class I SAM-dependent methyltransferase [Halorhodospira abdelmalekii]MBK1735243.1 hypothetical protein [Halorhodospira abdelmalekii]
MFAPAHDSAERSRITKRAYAGATEFLERLRAVGMASKAGQRLLEVGCGSGVHTVAAAKAFDGIEVVAVEPDFGFFAEAKKRLRSFSNASVQVGHAENLRFADQTFDAYYARLVYQHCTAPLKALAEARRVLRPDGWCMIDDIDRGWFMSWPEPEPVRELWGHVEAAQAGAGGDPFVGRKLHSWLRASGFAKVRVDVRGVSTDGVGIAEFASCVGESLLDMLPAADRNAGRAVLAEWAAQAAADPSAHRLYVGWFMATASPGEV